MSADKFNPDFQGDVAFAVIQDLKQQVERQQRQIEALKDLVFDIANESDSCGPAFRAEQRIAEIEAIK